MVLDCVGKCGDCQHHTWGGEKEQLTPTPTLRFRRINSHPSSKDEITLTLITKVYSITCDLGTHLHYFSLHDSFVV